MNLNESYGPVDVPFDKFDIVLATSERACAKIYFFGKRDISEQIGLDIRC